MSEGALADPFHRTAEPVEIAEAAGWLICDRASYQGDEPGPAPLRDGP